MGYIFLIDIKNIYGPFGKMINVFLKKIQKYILKRKRYIVRNFFKHSRLRRKKEEKVARKSYFDTIIKPKKMISSINIK